MRGNVWHGGLRFNTSKNAVVEAAKAGWRGNKSKNAVVEAAKAGLDQASAPAGAEIAGGYMPAWSG
ncbi:hypothetical protein [Paenibacillus riograndensis]|uniref:hypothetical protein n=1 Tax=Paenibacillus riograndensis TaxID=483937 RepID=UPI0003148FE5|nr:hypothetical protein [Paenibacillus riograndensis]